jgi:hypothetical protein
MAVHVTFIVDWLDRSGELNGALPWKQIDRHWVFKACQSGLYEHRFRQDEGPLCVARPF